MKDTRAATSRPDGRHYRDETHERGRSTPESRILDKPVGSGRQATREPPTVRDRRKPRLSRVAPNLDGWRQPRAVVKRSRLDDRELGPLGQQRDDRRAALRAELAPTLLTGISPHGHVCRQRVAINMKRCARDGEKDEPVWRWQSSQWQRSVTIGSPLQRRSRFRTGNARRVGRTCLPQHNRRFPPHDPSNAAARKPTDRGARRPQ